MTYWEIDASFSRTRAFAAPCTYLVIDAVLIAADQVSPKANACAVCVFDVVVADDAPVGPTANAWQEANDRKKSVRSQM